MIDTTNSKLPAFQNRQFSFTRHFWICTKVFFPSNSSRHFVTYVHCNNQKVHKSPTLQRLPRSNVKTAQHRNLCCLKKWTLFSARISISKSHDSRLETRPLRNDHIRMFALGESAREPSRITVYRTFSKTMRWFKNSNRRRDCARLPIRIRNNHAIRRRTKFAIRRWREHQSRLAVCEREPETGPQAYITSAMLYIFRIHIMAVVVCAAARADDRQTTSETLSPTTHRLPLEAAVEGFGALSIRDCRSCRIADVM